MLRKRLLTLSTTLALAACQRATDTVTAAFGTEPVAPTSSAVVNVLCTRAEGGAFVFGKFLPSHGDTEATQDWLIRHNDAWDAATEKGRLCTP